MPIDSAAPVRMPVDLDHLRRFTMGDISLEQEILGLFAEHAPKSLASLTDAADAIAWRAAAHSLKGSARAVGADVAELAAVAELAYPEETDAKLQQLAAVSAAIDAARDYIAQLQAPFATRQA
jgi:HPt (histidine-containing phosphotransfer) domain-containing protein